MSRLKARFAISAQCAFAAGIAAYLAAPPLVAAPIVRMVALTGQQAPGSPSGVNFLLLGGPALNAAGQTAFYATLAGSGVDGTNDSGIWSEGSGTLGLVAREGSQAPGTQSGVNYNSFIGLPALNAAGQTAFYAHLTGTGVDATNDRGIWSEGSGTLHLVARKGSYAPSTPGDISFSLISYHRCYLMPQVKQHFMITLPATV